jgi:hypothetical protein
LNQAFFFCFAILCFLDWAVRFQSSGLGRNIGIARPGPDEFYSYGVARRIEIVLELT